VNELTGEEREFVIWALGYIQGVSMEMHDDDTGKRAWVIAEKLKEPSQARPDLLGLEDEPWEPDAISRD
jgi:hypothetical protein